MNSYALTFTNTCPINGAPIEYALCIVTSKMVPVETLQAFVAGLPPDYHECIADALLERFGGEQVMIAQHHGVRIETRRGAGDPKGAEIQLH